MHRPLLPNTTTQHLQDADLTAQTKEGEKKQKAVRVTAVSFHVAGIDGQSSECIILEWILPGRRTCFESGERRHATSTAPEYCVATPSRFKRWAFHPIDMLLD